MIHTDLAFVMLLALILSWRLNRGSFETLIWSGFLDRLSVAMRRLYRLFSGKKSGVYNCHYRVFQSLIWVNEDY